MTLKSFRTSTATTQRMTSSTGTRNTRLTEVKVVPAMTVSKQGQDAVRELAGLQGTAVQIYETYTEPHTHTDDGVSVNQLPDIKNGDLLTVDGTTYQIQYTERQPATGSFSETLIMYLIENKRA